MKQNRFIQKKAEAKQVERRRKRIRVLNGLYRFSDKGVSWLTVLERNLVFAAFLTLMGIIYIWNTHRAERHARQADALSQQVRELESEYNTLNANLAKNRRQSAILEMADSLGLHVPAVPPIKLEVKP
ncbi:MAG: hypothetical protein KF690_01450 [Bacteroidetes bacterium]|nr:hypothetical protein [Bacteroidota bacterium]